MYFTDIMKLCVTEGLPTLTWEQLDQRHARQIQSEID